jgi:hypothetical protein
MARSSIAAQNLTAMTAVSGFGDKAVQELCRSEGVGDGAGWQQALVERYGPEGAQDRVGAFVRQLLEDKPPQSEPQPATTGPAAQPGAAVSYYRPRPPSDRPPPFE